MLRHASYLNAGAITGILFVGDGISAVFVNGLTSVGNLESSDVGMEILKGKSKITEARVFAPQSILQIAFLKAVQRKR